MRRRVLLTSAVLGSIVTLLGFTGLIAPFTDRATTGTNSIETGARAKEVDLQLALRADGACGAFTDDLTTGLISATDAQPGGPPLSGSQVCLKNAGSSAAAVTVSALNLTDVDTGCTGDEVVLDTTCGGNAAGELAPHVNVGFLPIDCASSLLLGGGSSSALGGLANYPVDTDLGPGEVVCLATNLSYAPASADDATRAQSDRVTWQFAFDGAQVTTP